jgi:hypothetical protein
MLRLTPLQKVLLQSPFGVLEAVTNPAVAGMDISKQLTKQAGWILNTFAVDPASLGAVATAATNVTVAGVTPQHIIFCSIQGAPSSGGVVPVGGVCTTPGTVAVQYSNPSAGSVDLTSHTLAILCIPPFNA